MPIPLPQFLLPLIALINVTPDPIAFHIGSIPVFWYGVCYAVGLAAVYVVITREARRRGLNARLVDNGIIIVAAAALIGGRMYHVIDQWQRYKDDLLSIVMPPYTGLGVYGGILTGVIAAAILFRLWKQPFWKWADVIAPGLFVMQAIGRWGNFFNQELYGPPTDLPWGITIDCAHRVAQYPCTMYPPATTGFHPLFLYESVSGILGAITLLWIARRWGPRMRPGDLFLIWLIWYATVRLALETLRTGNWTVLGVPTATIISALVIVGALVVLAVRHRPGAAGGDRWGDPPEPSGDAEVAAELEVPADEPAAVTGAPGEVDQVPDAPTANVGDQVADSPAADVGDWASDAAAVVVDDATEDAAEGGGDRPGDGT
jgi:phosphatidylglycerol:prolipoprotein diacylglycerol transferase